MSRHEALWLLAVAAVAAAACGGGDSAGDGTFRPDAGSAGNVASSSSGSSNRDASAPDDDAGDPDASSSSGGEGDGGGSSSGGSSGASSSGASSSSGSGGLPPLCAGDAEPGAELGMILEMGTPAPAFVTVSDDGLTAAWVTGTAGNIEVHYADRAGVALSFGSALTLQGEWALDRVAVGEVGRLLVAVRADRLGFVAFTRSERGVAFTAAAQDPFSNLNAEAEAMAAAGQSYADPILARFDSFFVYSLQGPGIAETVRVGSKVPVSIPYSVGAPIGSPAFLLASGDNLRRPVSLSADQRTLFYFDEVDDLAYVTSRNDSGGEFSTPIALGPRLDARPIPGCGTLVYRDPSAPTQLRSVAFE